MVLSFINIRILDGIDIVLVAFLLYQIYMLIRGTIAINIFIVIAAVYLIWLVVKALNMQLLSTILGQFMGVGMIALIIVFQQEIRRFLLMIGSKYKFDKHFSFDKMMNNQAEFSTKTHIDEITKAVENLSKGLTGALILITRKSELMNIVNTGDLINANIFSRLIENLFFKNSPLHDGAIIITGHKIVAARCILPVSEKTDLPPEYGLRHRAALGITEITDALVIIVSEETGKISFVKEGMIKENIDVFKLKDILISEL
ncbi:MAG: diadenylate cyclase CdaA [Bacteroidota bacterium]